MRRGGGRKGWRREGVILLIREVGAYSAVRVNFELWEGGKDGWRGKESGILVIRGLLSYFSEVDKISGWKQAEN